jgi:hypothetical protein
MQFAPLGNAYYPLTCILSPADGGEELSPLPLAGEGQGEGGFFRLPTCLALAFYLLALNHTHAAEITIAGKPYATLVDALNAAATTS